MERGEGSTRELDMEISLNGRRVRNLRLQLIKIVSQTVNASAFVSVFDAA